MQVLLESIGDHSLKQTLLLQLVLDSGTMWERNSEPNPRITDLLPDSQDRGIVWRHN